MKKYQNGEFGDEHLTLHDILSVANAPDLLDKMTTEDFQVLIDKSTGMTKLMFQTILEARKSRVKTRLNPSAPYSHVSPRVRRACYPQQRSKAVRCDRVAHHMGSVVKKTQLRDRLNQRCIRGLKVKK